MHMTDKLEKSVAVSRQFLRSVNLEADLGRSDALHGYICQDTAAELIKTMAHHINRTHQRAFTWTGPYGGGKSSLALMLASFVSPNMQLRQQARNLLGPAIDDDVELAWKASSEGWLVVPVVGKRDSAISAISSALDKLNNVNTKRPKSKDLIARLIAEAEQRKNDGVLLVLDELGKFLESAAITGEDVYFYQQLAEAASRCNGKLVIVGILHQAFEQYAVKLGRDTRDEWAKIQGRYIDIPLIVRTDEVIELVGRAIEKQGTSLSQNVMENLAEITTDVILKRKLNAPKNLKSALINCWPIHPVTSVLLGPISRKRFSQNERSVFGFLASAEPLGFTNFLKNTPNDGRTLYTPHMYWDYLKANMEQAIHASSDSHIWAAAIDAIERTEARKSCSEVHVNLAKTIALIDMFKAGSGLAAENALIEICIDSSSKEEIRAALEDLARWTIITFRKHLNAWTIYSGSDFDIDSAVNEARSELGEVDVKQLVDLAELNPVVAKRHFHETGTLRWLGRSLIHSDKIESYLNDFQAKPGAAGEFILIIPNSNFSSKQNIKLLQELSEQNNKFPIVLGHVINPEKVYGLGMELSALELVQKTRRELDGDAVARKEINGRISVVKTELADELKSAFDSASWYYSGQEIKSKNGFTLSSIASKLVEECYYQTPRVYNELINRESISSNVVKARRDLMYKMLSSSGIENLGYLGFSADAGLFYTVIRDNNLYQLAENEWVFNIADQSTSQLIPLWEAADKLFRGSEKSVTLSELYEVWQAPPIGARRGVLPIFALIYFLSNRHQLSLYIENNFIPDLTEAYLDEWMQDTKRIAFKHVEIGKDRKELLKSLSLSLGKTLGRSVAPTPLESARGLVNLIANLPSWTKRTSSVSDEAQELRRLILKANDPYKVLFFDIPIILKVSDEVKLIDKITKLTEELQLAYPKMIKRLESILFKTLDHQGDVANLRKRAEAIKGMSGDFQLDGFIANLSVIEDYPASLEGILATTVHKNPKDWVDRDQEASINALGEMCAKFRKIETFGTLRGKHSARNAFSFVYSDPNKAIISEQFDVSEDRIPKLKEISKELLTSLRNQGLSKDEILATFAECCEQTIEQEGL
jgi:hypothetical protein